LTRQGFLIEEQGMTYLAEAEMGPAMASAGRQVEALALEKFAF
jgi:hypothetical protein